MDQTLNNNSKSNTQILKKENNTMEKKNHTLWNHDELFYKVLDKLKEKLDSGAINQEEYDIMREKAIADESDLRRKDIEYTSCMFDTIKTREGDIPFYLDKICEYIDDLYISCKCTLIEKKIAKDTYLDFTTHFTKNYDRNVYERDKKIYEDILSGKLDILHISEEKLFNIYGEC